MRLQTRRKFCSCGGTIVHHRDRSSQVTVYTETGPLLVEHLECRGKKCSRGHYYGYATDTVEDQEDANARKQYKFYEEDCLESQVTENMIKVVVANMFYVFQFLITTRKTGFSIKFLYEMSLDILFLFASFR